MNNEERLTIKLAVKKIKIPMLIIHGAADTTVMEKEARLLHKWNPLSELKVLEKAVEELKIIGVYKQNFDNEPSQLLNTLINEK